MGDLVWLHSFIVLCSASRKFHQPWTGPYKIVKKLADVTYRVQNCRGRRRQLVVHFDHLKPCPKDMRIKESTQSQDASSMYGGVERGLVRGPVTSPIIHDWDDNDDEAVDSDNSQTMDRIDVDNPTDGIHHGQSDDRAQGAPVVKNDNVSITDDSGGSQPIDS